jgi:cobalt/nickel transport system permease protein
MASLEQEIHEFGQLDRLSYQDTPVHRLDPRAKVLTTLVFLVCVVSFDKYAVLPLLPFLIFPVAMASLGNIPTGFLLRKLLIVSPFAIVVGIFNPVLDSQVVFHLGSWGVSAGWISYLSILLRFTLTTLAALILIGTTSLTAICAGIERMGAPDVFATQLLFLYRYIFALADEVLRMSRARALRSFGRKGMGIGVYSNILGHLLLRTYARAQRVYLAMTCRGFDGHVRTMRRLHFAPRDALFVAGWSAVFVVFRRFDVPQLLGQFVTGLIS